MNDEHPPSRFYQPFIQSVIGLFHKQNSKADLREYLQEAQENNIIDNDAASMIAGVLDVSEQRVRDVMLPKSKMVVVADDMSLDDAVKQVLDSGHSRFPVERDEQIIGIILAKDLLNYFQQSPEHFLITDIMRPVRHIPESKPLDRLLSEFRHQRLHMMMVTNEYGNISGLVTIEDVLEEIVGEIGDEHDNEAAEDIRKLDNNEFFVAALTEVEAFNQFFGTTLDEEAYDTIGGFVLSHFGYVPKNGESVSFSGWKFRIKRADDRRIHSLIVQQL